MKTFAYDAQIASSPSVVAELISGPKLPDLDPSLKKAIR
jgi:hypothetical protein